MSDSLQTSLHVQGCGRQGTSSAEATGASTDTAGAHSDGHARLAAVVHPAAVASTAAAAAVKDTRQHARDDARGSKSSRKARAAAGSKHPAKKHLTAAAASVGTAAAAAAGVAAATSAAADKQAQERLLHPGGCVHQPWFWKQCMLQRLTAADAAACGVITKRLPGGLGPKTPFFPYQKAPRVRRTYRQLMVMPKKTGNALVDLHFLAAQLYISTQMNQFWGVQLPHDVKKAYAQLARDYFRVYDDKSVTQQLPQLPRLHQQVAHATRVLADFNRGKYPGLPTCAAANAAHKVQQVAAAAPHEKQVP